MGDFLTLLFGFSEYLRKNTNSLAREIVEAVLRKMNLEIPEWEKEQAVIMYVELLGFLSELVLDERKDTAPEALIKWSKQNAAMQVSSGGTISEIAVRYPPTRQVFLELFTKISSQLGLSLNENVFIIKQINTLLDISLNETIFAFERLSDQLQEENQKELARLSAPIVPVKDDVVVIPLIGEFSEYRLKYIADHVIPKISEMDVDFVIADLSGIFNLNKEIAKYFDQIGVTLQLMGIRVLTTGLRPEVVQAVISSQSVDPSKIEAFATVKQALESLQ